MSWMELARRQGGAVSHAQLAAAGFSGSAIGRLVDGAQLSRLYRGVYLAGAAPFTRESALWAAVLVTDGVLGFATAAHLWGITDEGPSRIDVMVPVDCGRRRITGIRLHRVPIDGRASERRHGLPVTSRTCTVLDHLGRLPRREALTVADRAIQQSWLRPSDVRRRLRNHPGRTGNATLRYVLDTTSDGAAARSERVLHQLLRRASVGGWTANFDVWANGELIAVVDVALPEFGIAVEVDGMAFHTDAVRFQRDRFRQNQLTKLGWTVLRFTWADLTERPAYVVSTIKAIIARSCAVGPGQRD